MEYSAFNPVVWGLFTCFVAVTWLAVRLHGTANPGYPGEVPGRDGAGAAPEGSSAQ